ncbi:MAG TPA: AMP-binding protein, partial [Mariprofundaceae bacterium]|nr:AMP-binding protein [Mariprofundaceae bacterium]
MSEGIDSVLHENRVFEPPKASGANIGSMDDYRAICQRFKQDLEGTWGELAREHLSWRKPFARVLNREEAPFFRWFEDGELNLSENCLDRHVEAGLGDRTAIIWEGEPGEVRAISYAELLADVCRAANAMRALGVGEGDRVVIYMPMIPEAAVAMLACTRIGATHSVVFGAFSPHALHERIEDASAKLVVTADGGYRR